MKFSTFFLWLACCHTASSFVLNPKTFTSRLRSTISADGISATSISSSSITQSPIYPFGKGEKGKSADDKWLLGGKGANLAEMSAIGLSVPPGFTLTTECCKAFCSEDEWNGEIPGDVWEKVMSSLRVVEEKMGCEFGSDSNPLLLSVRSGAAISMPGMMDTVLNLGMNDVVVESLSKKSGNDRFAWDSYRRFLEMFGNVVLEIPRAQFEEVSFDYYFCALYYNVAWLR